MRVAQHDRGAKHCLTTEACSSPFSSSRQEIPAAPKCCGTTLLGLVESARFSSGTALAAPNHPLTVSAVPSASFVLNHGADSALAAVSRADASTASMPFSSSSSSGLTFFQAAAV